MRTTKQKTSQHFLWVIMLIGVIAHRPRLRGLGKSDAELIPDLVLALEEDCNQAARRSSIHHTSANEDAMADEQTVLELIERAAREGWTELNLSGKDLTNLPPEITKLTKLTLLNLSFNELTTLPPEITHLTNLTSLNLWANRLTSLPPELGKLTNLTELILWENELTSTPPEIIRLTSLTRLELSENQLTILPPEITELANLTRLNLTNNQLTSLPPKIARLTNLILLHLRDNQLTSLPPEITRLTNLASLDLRDNQLTSLPPEITRLTKLTFLYLSGNKLPIPPEALADQSAVKTIFAALAGLETGEQLNEAKMLVVGDGKVGKSSVVEQLIYGTFNPRKQTTLGVEINDEMKVVQSEVIGEGEPIKLNVWDFGGQENSAFNASVLSDHPQPLPAGGGCSERRSDQQYRILAETDRKLRR